MRRLRFLPGVLLCLALAVTLSACPEQEMAGPAPITGTLRGTVTIDGEPAPGIAVGLSSGASTTTAADGSYEFADVTEGAYAVTISGIPPDVSFVALSKAAVVSVQGQVVTVDFAGTTIRTSAVTGTVSVDGEGLEGVTVTLGGRTSATTTTGPDGTYAFGGLPAGEHTVGIAGFPADVGFDDTSVAVDLEVGETEVVDFEGMALDGGIAGQVLVGTEPQPGVTARATHAGTGEMREDVTDTGGAFLIPGLRLGPWEVEISGWDPARVTFPTPVQEADLTEAQPTVSVVFEGIFLPGTVAGTVVLDATPAEGQTVRLTDVQGTVATATTDASGAYAFEDVPAGPATVEVDASSEVECEDHPREIEVPPGGSATADFECTTRPDPVSFLTRELAGLAEGPVATNQTAEAPLRDASGGVVGQAIVETGSGGAYSHYPSLDKFFLDAPGSVTLRFALLPVFALYPLIALDFVDAFGIGQSCLLELALLDPSGQVLAAVTYAVVAQQSLSLDLDPAAVAVRMAFVAVTAGACANAYASFSGGRLR